MLFARILLRLALRCYFEVSLLVYRYSLFSVMCRFYNIITDTYVRCELDLLKMCPMVFGALPIAQQRQKPSNFIPW